MEKVSINSKIAWCLEFKNCLLIVSYLLSNSDDLNGSLFNHWYLTIREEIELKYQLQSHKHKSFVYFFLCFRNFFNFNCCLGFCQHWLIDIVSMSIFIIGNSFSECVFSYHFSLLHVMRLSLIFGIFLLLIPPPFVHLRLR